MSASQAGAKIYHITHVNNLPSILADGYLASDREMIARGGPVQGIGLSDIKKRRVEELGVACHVGTMVGDYVPFFFCPRSVMLFVIHCANHQGLTYLGGQEPIIHLEADLHEVIDWAEAKGVRWAFSLTNAGASFTEFRNRRDALDELDWEAIRAKYWSAVKDKKQAEFLLHERFPFDLIQRIGVHSSSILRRAQEALAGSHYAPPAVVCPDWFY